MKTTQILTLSTLAAAVGLLAGGGAFAADTNVAGQDVGYQVNEVALISLTGTPGDLIISTTTDGLAGSELKDAEDATVDWAITSNKAAPAGAKKVTAVLTGNMPAHTELFIELAACEGAASAGKTPLNTRADGVKVAAVDVVTSIDPVVEDGLTVTYTFSADVTAGVVANADATVTLTLTDS
jgi:hypothetical protein